MHISLKIVIHFTVMDQKENNKKKRIENIKEKAERIHVQHHKCHNAYTKHNDKELNAPLFHVPDTNNRNELKRDDNS